jgi:hydroxyethylthiazole kinase-like uncharacterized protein yjeF
MKKTAATAVTPALLRDWGLPQHDEGDDKEGRGRIFVVGGSAQIPGAILLAALASLRAGAGQLKIATAQSIAAHIAIAVPESWVLPLPETSGGGFDPACADEVAENANNANAVLFGPGMMDPDATSRLLHAALPQIQKPTLVLDAAPLACLGDAPDLLHSLGGNVIVTPHAGEMAAMLGQDKAEIKADPQAAALEAAAKLKAVVAMKGSRTFIAAPDGRLYLNRYGNIGLATSGSGDTLAGIIAGLAARGADPVQATVWGVYLHARAGDALAKRVGPLGFLARELLAEIPALMCGLGKKA